YKLNSVKRPSETINLAEAYVAGVPSVVPLPAAYDIDDFESWIPFGYECYCFAEPTAPGYQAGTGAARLAHRHMKTTSCCFYDGHGERIKTKTPDSMVRNTVDCLWENY